MYLDLIGAEEVRPYLNAHFLCCRILSKILISPTADASERSKHLIAAMKHYEWLAKKAILLCEKKKILIRDVFEEELIICQELVELLPSKISRIHYLGEVAFDL